jgi:Zn-dependent peptidase ImmA (M78 family)
MVSRQAIAKYEKGLAAPSPEVLEHLLQVLEIPAPPAEVTSLSCFIDNFRARNVSYKRKSNADRQDLDLKKPGADNQSAEDKKLEWLEPTRVYFCLNRQDLQPASLQKDKEKESFIFRCGLKLSSKQLTALRIQIAEKIEKYLRLETLLKAEHKLTVRLRNSFLANLTKQNRLQGITPALDLGTGPVVNILTFLEDRGIKIFKLAGPEGFESCSGFYLDSPFIAVNQNLPVDRLRFKTSTELAQILFGFSEDPDQLKLYNRWAAAFLMPARKLEEYFLPAGRKIALSELAEIKLRYGISLQAIMYRAFELSLITGRRLRAFRELLSQKGWLTKEPVVYRGEEFPQRFKRLIHYAVSSEILDLKTAASLAETTPEDLSREIGEIF